MQTVTGNRAGNFARMPFCRCAHSRQEHPMLDVVMLVIGLAFFALSVGYTFACDRL
jgi:hypothetical protein